LSESAIEFFPPLSIVSLHGIKFWQMRAANPDQPPPIIKHLNVRSLIRSRVRARVHPSPRLSDIMATAY